MVAGKAVFEGVLKFVASKAGKKFDSTTSAAQIEEVWSGSPSTK